MQLLELNFNLKHTFSQKPKYIKKEYKTDSQMHTLNHNTNCYVRACTCIDGFYSLVITFYNTLMSKLDTKNVLVLHDHQLIVELLQWRKASQMC